MRNVIVESVATRTRVLDQYVSQYAAMYHADCIEGIRAIPDSSVDFSVFSPPFVSLYTYSASDRDCGNNRGDAQFYEHMTFLAAEQFRTMRPGRLVALHCMDLPTTITHDGYVGFKDFSADLIRTYQRAGFIYHCPRITIWKDPEVAANRTYARQLTHHEMVKDSAMSGTGAPDYIVIMRKPGVNEVPIHHDGDALATKDDAGKPRHWQRWASPVWGWADADRPTLPSGTILAGLVDVAFPVQGDDGPESVPPALACYAFTADGRVYWRDDDGAWNEEHDVARRQAALMGALRRSAGIVPGLPPMPQFAWATANGLWNDGFVDYESPRAGNTDHRGIDQGDTLNFRAARENQDERHLCPLQIGVIDRLLDLYTNPGDKVLTPFMGVGSEVWCAVRKGRFGLGFELKASYFAQAVANVKLIEPGAKGQQLSMLDEPMPTVQGPAALPVPAPNSLAVPMGVCSACDEPGPVGATCGVCGSEVAA